MAAKGTGRGKPFQKGFDSRRNYDGPDPELLELKRQLKKDGYAFLDHLFRESAKLNANATRFALEQILGKAPAAIVLTGPEGKPLQLEATHLSKLDDEQLAVIKAARAVIDRLGRPADDGGDRAGGTPAPVRKGKTG